MQDLLRGLGHRIQHRDTEVFVPEPDDEVGATQIGEDESFAQPQWRAGEFLHLCLLGSHDRPLSPEPSQREGVGFLLGHEDRDLRDGGLILEGQATVAQIPVLMPEQKPDTFALGWFWRQRAVMAAQQAQMKEFARAPLWLREGLIFPYLGGADFIVWFRHKYFGVSVLDSMPQSTEQILHPERYAAHDEPTDLAFSSGEPDTVQYEDGLGEFETRLLFQQHLGNEAEAVTLATGWDGDRYQVLGPKSDALIWYSVWDDAAAASRFAAGLQRAWAIRRAGGPTGGGRRAEIKQLTIQGRPCVRLVDAPAAWKGWRAIPTVRLSATGG